VSLDATGNVTITVGDIDAGSTADCFVQSITLSETAFDCSDVGSQTVTLTITDVAGNSDNCTATVKIIDDTDPTIGCPADITVDNDAGQCSAVVTYASPTTADNCPGETLGQDAGLASGAAFPVGTTTNTFTVTDASSNTASCSFAVTVNDAEDPTI
ncbi:MAG: HYR domain-containing protein, partial [Saprospiraceae bacterium]|nr:HYR domain-containing protein [Saprospiraceae bacterium]